MSYQAIHRFARIAPTKVRHLATLIRGKTVSDGLNALRYSAASRRTDPGKGAGERPRQRGGPRARNVES